MEYKATLVFCKHGDVISDEFLRIGELEISLSHYISPFEIQDAIKALLKAETPKNIPPHYTKADGTHSF